MNEKMRLCNWVSVAASGWILLILLVYSYFDGSATSKVLQRGTVTERLYGGTGTTPMEEEEPHDATTTPSTTPAEDNPFRREYAYQMKAKHRFQWFYSFLDDADQVDLFMFQALPENVAYEGDGEGTLCPGMHWWSWWNPFSVNCMISVTHLRFYPDTPDEWKSLETVDQDLLAAFDMAQTQFQDKYDMEWTQKPHYPTDYAEVWLILDLIASNGQQTKTLDDAVFFIFDYLEEILVENGYPEASIEASYNDSPTALDDDNLDDDNVDDDEIYNDDNVSPPTSANVQLTAYSNVEYTSTLVHAITVQALHKINDQEDWFTVRVVGEHGGGGELMGDITRAS